MIFFVQISEISWSRWRFRDTLLACRRKMEYGSKMDQH